ncbi:hypothetical protein F8388_018912 [Cannabis sativa]|uniref:Uncharacterized protein n=1 Tax=Cannabis sativa TaxID=3483 RepID=A0A7J6FZR5_CANSA|nr:hypothetical protein F8388_018912 [Cannabis sativa]
MQSKASAATISVYDKANNIIIAATTTVFFIKFLSLCDIGVREKVIRVGRSKGTTYAEVLEKALEAELCESRIQKDNTARWEARKASNGGGDNKRKLPSNQHNEADKRNKIGSNNYKRKKPYVEYPLCPTCGRKHLGECRLKGKTCYKCGNQAPIRRTVHKRVINSRMTNLSQLEYLH